MDDTSTIQYEGDINVGSAIGGRRQAFWNENGFLVLPGFFSEADIGAVSGAVDHAWSDLGDRVVVDDLVTARRCRIGSLSEEERQHRFKVNDLYLEDAALRDVGLSARLGMVLSELLGDEPVVCNSLNFEKGSQQADHLDTLFMTPLTQGKLVATWMALEDTEMDAGPLRYYPGSNHIDPYVFSTGSMHVHHSEMDRWSDYMAGQVDRKGLAEQRFLAKRGDLFIWHAYLLHGGSEICNPGLTRRSLVTHYFAQGDCENLGGDLRPAAGGWWMRRPPQPVPDDQPTGRPTPEPQEHQPDLPAALSAAPAAAEDGLLAPGRELRDRMEPLKTATD
jgi:phytanoyl-CoA hydroxylase